MFCGECNLEDCSYEVVPLTSEHISQEYLESLNDKDHLAHSRNVTKSFTKESQVAYIENFDFVNNLILGLICSKSKKLLSTASLVVDQKRRLINIGILIFRNFSNRGYGHLILKNYSDFCFEIFPGFPQEIGTKFENFAMRKIALKAGFVVSREDGESGFIYFLRTFSLQENLKFLSKPPLLVVANDAGGSTHLAAMLYAYNISCPTRLSGPAIEIFNRFGVDSKKSSLSHRFDSSDYILLGTSLFGGPESQVLTESVFSGVCKIALLDHWVNYEARFHPSGKMLPEIFLVPNQFAYLKAKRLFPDSKVLEIPDFQLAFMKLAYMKKLKNRHSALVLLEPESETSFSVRYPQISLDKLVAQVREIARDRDVHRIILRPHPAHTPAFVRELSELFFPAEDVTVSTNMDLLDDLITADFVVGSHTYALYLAAELKVQTFGFFADEPSHWTRNFPKIHSVRNKK